MSKPIKHIVIVGGGSAGWLTAGILAAAFRAGAGAGPQVTLVESPDVKPIGVGEGTWPSMRDSLSAMGVSETDFIRECDVSFKQASRFDRWVTGNDEDSYYHPFAMPQGYGEVDLVEQWQLAPGSPPFADVVSYQPQLCRQGKAPKQQATPEWAAVANYAYHLDAGKFGVFLQKFCTGRLDVRHVLDNVTGVNPAENGDIGSLETRHYGSIEGDLFIDCTGFSSLLLGGHYEIPFISRKDVLFCDSAMALQVPYANDDSPVESNTISTAQSAGWIWDIGLPTRRGVGYVYSSSHTTDEEAEAALQRYVAGTGQGSNGGRDAARKISINPGHRETFWHRNCVAVGISAGFIEPLEASALALIEMSAAMIRDDMPATRESMDVISRRFNERFRYRWGRVIDFLKLHYVLSQRTDSDFWRDNRSPETIPTRLQELLELWRYRSPSRRDFYEIEEIFPSASYQYVLYGMGFQPETAVVNTPGAARFAMQYFDQTRQTTGKFLAGLPSNRELTHHVAMHGMPKI